MGGKVWDVMGNKAGYTLLMATLDNIHDVAPTTAFERGDAIDLVYTGPSTPRGGAAQAFASGVGSLTDKKT
ncbi:MAG: hypothetical protein B193_2525 [Solidesulfovibrio magneticus str. Maddingley MBC34]|uniref:Uncharacterized protein n=1 Tax=Solidesulfovibrio magneticus str. Maddingley MBC34 TaxID=1206767 RepID=K6GP96_9BACT|nr:MAG: hypothetical protein B193_2525 [Solidesulfovibrio magneticus str. Maddingley MBC34]